MGLPQCYHYLIPLPVSTTILCCKPQLHLHKDLHHSHSIKRSFLIPVNLNYSDPTAILALVQTVIGDGDAPFPAISETFDGTIAARYCPPEVTLANRSDMIQLFMSGVTENNLYRFGLGCPNGYDGDMYSTVAYASKQGYPTLAIDRAGIGNSTHPDPATQQEVNLETAIAHQLVLKLKAGTAVQGKVSFSHCLSQ